MEKTRAWVASQCRFAMGPKGLPGAAWLDLRQPTRTPHGATMVARPGSEWCKKCKEWVDPELGCEHSARSEVPGGPPENY